MNREGIIHIVDEIYALSQRRNPIPDLSAVEGYRFEAVPPVPWNKRSVEEAFQITIPLDLEVLWNHASAMHLFQLVSSINPTGLTILSPDNLNVAQEEARTMAFPRDLQPSDLVIGVHRVLYDFRVIIRCDSSVDDFGFIFVTQEMEHRHEWVYAAESLTEFLRRYIDAVGQEYWHGGEFPHVRS